MKKSLGAKVLIVPSPVWCIGTYNNDGTPNVMTASWAGICCSEPPCLAVSLRKATLTHGNIMRDRVFSVSVPSKKHAKEADYFGIVSGKKMNKFEVSGVTATRCEKVNAPYVSEFPLVAECRVVHISELGLHTQFVGEIVDIKVDASALSSGGVPDMEKIEPFLYSAGTSQYFSVGPFMGEAFELGAKS